MFFCVLPPCGLSIFIPSIKSDGNLKCWHGTGSFSVIVLHRINMPAAHVLCCSLVHSPCGNSFHAGSQRSSPAFPWWSDASLSVTAGHILLHHYGLLQSECLLCIAWIKRSSLLQLIGPRKCEETLYLSVSLTLRREIVLFLWAPYTVSTNVQTKMIYSVMVSSFCICFPIFVFHLQLTAPFQRARTDVSHTHIFRRQCFKSHVSSRSVS